MRDVDNIRAIEALDIDLMGFIFYAQSPRYVSVMPDYLPEKCCRTGIFVDEQSEKILARVREFGLRAVQLHGKESPIDCISLRNEGLLVIKTFSIGNDGDLGNVQLYEGKCDYYLFDTACATHGGSGKRFDWSLLRQYKGHTPFLLSGGITPECLDNVLVFRHSMLAGIDLNSGFEVSPGVKDVSLIKEFLNKLNNYEQNKSTLQS